MTDNTLETAATHAEEARELLNDVGLGRKPWFNPAGVNERKDLELAAILAIAHALTALALDVTKPADG